MYWTQPELDLLSTYADSVYERRISYYRACRTLTDPSHADHLNRTYEAVRSKLKLMVNVREKLEQAYLANPVLDIRNWRKTQ